MNDSPNNSAAAHSDASKQKYLNDLGFEPWLHLDLVDGQQFPICDVSDKYTITEEFETSELRKTHRWTAEDVGKCMLISFPSMFKDSRVYIIVKLTSVRDSSRAELRIGRAIDVKTSRGRTYPIYLYGTFDFYNSVNLNGSEPISKPQFLNLYNLLQSDEAEDRMELYLAIQTWAFQPLKNSHIRQHRNRYGG